MSTNNVSTVTQQYLDNIQTQFDNAEAYIQTIESDPSIIEHDDASIHQLASQTQHVGSGFWNHVLNNYTTNHPVTQKIASLHASTARLNSALHQAESGLEALEPGFTSLDCTINGLLNAVNSLTNQNVGSQFTSDLAKIQSYLSQIFTAMNAQLQADEDQAIVKNAKQGVLSADQIEQYSEGKITADSSVNSILSGLIQTMTNDKKGFVGLYTQAKENLTKDDFWQNRLFANGTARGDRNQQVMNGATTMEKALISAISNLAPEMASLMPQFMQLQVAMEEVLRKVMKILDDMTLSPKEKSANLLGLMMYLLGFFNIVQQDSEGQKAENQKLMAQANLVATQINLMIEKMNQVIQKDEADEAKITEMVTFIAKIVMGVIFTALSGGVGSGLVIAALTVASCTGGPYGKSALDKLTSAIAKATGQTWAEVIVTAVEIAMTLGGAGIDLGASKLIAAKAMDAAVTSGVAGVRNRIEEESLDIGEAAALRGADGTATQIAAANILEVGAKKAAETAAKTVQRLFARQAFGTQLRIICSRTYGEKLAQAMNEAAAEAAQTFVKEASESMATGFADLTTKETDYILIRAAKNAVANITDKSVQAVGKAIGTSAARIAGTRAVAAAIYGVMSNNLLLDGVEAYLKKHGDQEDSAIFEKWQVAMSTVQSIIEMIAQMGMSGMSATAVFNGSPQDCARVGAIAQTSAQGASGLASLGNGQVDLASAKAEEALAIGQALSEILQMTLDQINQSGKLEFQRFIDQQKQLQQSDAGMASHLHDGDNAGIQVLSEQAV